MKRVLTVLCLFALPSVAFAFDNTRRPERIAVLRPAVELERGQERLVQNAVTSQLTRELRRRGFDAFDAEQTYDETAREGTANADYLIEIAGGSAESVDHGGIGIRGRHAEVSLGVVMSRVAAELRVYDGRTMELLASENLSRRSTAVLPTGVGLGGADFFAWVALPFVERAQVRGIARAAARDAASVVSTTVRGQ